MGTEPDERLGIASSKIEQATRSSGTNERRLTDAMCALLSTDQAAALSFVNLLLSACDLSRVRNALGASQLDGPVAVYGEGSYSARRSLWSSRTQARRFDLLFVAGSRAVAVEVKLEASLADRQLEDLLRVDVEQFGLDRNSRLGVIVLGPRELELGATADPRDRLLKRSAVRWSAVVEEMTSIRFEAAGTEQMWTKGLFGLYLRRGAFGSRSVVRPTPRVALEALAVPLRDHVQQIVGESHMVRLDADRGLRVTAGRKRVANVEIVIERRRRPRRERRITVWLEVPKGGRRTATISRSDAQDADQRFAAPAALGPLEALLKSKLQAALTPCP
ncbi:MAG: hypothetical protein M3376_07055 [Actinomycetota bacterium]|nr:hypothetical protein [Actinomycetota bacterium]